MTQPLTEISTRNISWGLRRPVRKADNLNAFMCRLTWNMGASTSWNPQGLSRPVMELLYLYLLQCTYKSEHKTDDNGWQPDSGQNRHSVGGESPPKPRLYLNNKYGYKQQQRPETKTGFVTDRPS
jgi:hypothetical protein